MTQITVKAVKDKFNLDKMYENKYILQEIQKVFNQLDKNWKSLNKEDTKTLEDIYDYLEANYYKCYVCDTYFDDHPFVNDNQPECYGCFTEKDYF